MSRARTTKLDVASAKLDVASVVESGMSGDYSRVRSPPSATLSYVEVFD